MTRSVIIWGVLVAMCTWSPANAFAQGPSLPFITEISTDRAGLTEKVEDDSGSSSNGLANYVEEIRTAGGAFIPTERIHFVSERGLAGQPDNGSSVATSGRGLGRAPVNTNAFPHKPRRIPDQCDNENANGS